MKKRKRILTSEQADARLASAIRGLDNLGLHEKADEIADLDPIDYAESKGFEVQNPTNNRKSLQLKEKIMPVKSRAALIAENERLKDENDVLNDTLERIASLASNESDDDEEDEDYEDDE